MWFASTHFHANWFFELFIINFRLNELYCSVHSIRQRAQLYNLLAVCAGEWLGGKAHGLGSYSFASGDFYEGEFEHNKFHGFGAFQKQCGLRTLGRWISGKLEGWSLVIFPNGKRFAAISETGINFSARGCKEVCDDRLSKTLIDVHETLERARKKISVIRQEQHCEI